MKLRRKTIILCFVVLISSLSSVKGISAAEGGGQVSSTSKITFYEGEKDPEPDPKPVTPPQKLELLPQTGEVMQSYFQMGLMMLVIATLIYFFKRKKIRGANHEKAG